MRTLIIITVGLVLAAVALRLAPSVYRTVAAATFTLIWLGVCVWNLRLGLSHGYSLSVELPIHLVLFGLPAVAAWSMWWLWRS